MTDIPWDEIPIVGSECMAQWLIPPDGGAMNPEPVLIKGYFGYQVWFTTRSGEDIVMLKNNVLFSPLPTKRDKWLEKAEKIEQALNDAYQPHDAYQAHELLEAIHDALLSGELPVPEQEEVK